MRRRRTDTHYVKEYWFIILVAMLLCGMMLLFIASIDKQLESKKSKLTGGNGHAGNQPE